MSALIIFISQFAVVFLLGIQSQMVRDGHCAGAAMGSLLIGVSQFLVFSIIGGLGANDILTMDGLAFLLSGPIAIVASMKTHPFLVKLIARGFDGSSKHDI